MQPTTPEPSGREPRVGVRAGSPRRRPRYWLRRLLAGLVALLVLALIALGIQWWRVPRDDVGVTSVGGLTIEDGLDGEHPAGPLTAHVDAALGILEIHDASGVVWKNDPRSAFLTAARGEVSVTEHRGYVWPATAHDEVFTEQTLTDISGGGSTLTLGGMLAGEGEERVPWRVSVSVRPEGGVAMAVTLPRGGADSIGLVSGRAGGAVHGLGAQFAPADLSGRVVPVIVREQGVGRGAQPLTVLADMTEHGAGGTESMTYAAWSSFLIDEDWRTFGVRLDPARPASHSFAVLDARSEDRVVLEVWAPRLDVQLTAGITPLDTIAAQQAGSERPAQAEWTTSGAIVGLQGGTEGVRRQVDSLLEAGAAISGVWLQDWSGQRTTSFGERLWWTWQLDEDRYPEWPSLVADLAEQGIATTTYVNPFVVDAGAKGDKRIRNLYAEAQSAGYLVRTEAGGAYLLDQGGFDAALVDLTNPDAREWYAQVIAEEVLADGVVGFMADFGEGLPFDAILAEGTPMTEHNRWPLLWAQTVREACALAGQPECVTWFRSGALGMDEFTPMFWAGDQVVDWSDQDGLRSALRGMLAAGVSGWPLVHSDVGGYTSVNAVVTDYVRTEELLARWAELEAFGVMMRTHEGNRPAANLQVSSTASTRSAFAGATSLYAALSDYRREVVATALADGVPALRPMWVSAPRTAAAGAQDQFFLGSSVLVAPVLDPGVTSVSVSFPPGEWVHLLTGERFAGDAVEEVDAPVGTPAAFVRADDPWAPGLLAALR